MKPAKISFLFFLLMVFSTCVFGQDYYDEYMRHRRAMINPGSGNDFIEAQDFFLNDFQQRLNNGDTINAVSALRLLGIGQFEIGLHNLAEINFTKALELTENLAEDSSTVEARNGINNQLGKVYKAQGQYDFSIAFYNKALADATGLKDSTVILGSLANVQKDLGNTLEAIVQYKKLLTPGLYQEFPTEYARVLNNLAVAEDRQGASGETFDRFHQALKIRSRNKVRMGLYSSYKSLSDYWKNRSNTDSARYYARRAYDLSKTINSLTFQEDALSRLLELQADSLTLAYLKVNDSLRSVQRTAQNRNSAMRFNFVKAEQQAALAEQKAEGEKLIRYYYQVMLFLGFIAAILFYLLIRNYHRREKQRKVFETESRISKRIHDEVANDLYHLMTQLENDPNTDSRVVDQLDALYQQTRDISRDIAEVDLDSFDISLQDLIISYRNDSTRIITRDLSKVKWGRFTEIQKTTLYRVIQELLTNMRKHSRASLVALSFTQEYSTLIIQYADNGQGTELKKGNGLQNTENRMEAINGSISFESKPGSGFKATIRL